MRTALRTGSPVRVESRIDYLTLTVSREASQNVAEVLGHQIVRERARRGWQDRDRARLGYIGSEAGGAFCGRRHDGVMIRLSGDAAAEHWEQVVELDGNPTRVDLAVNYIPEFPRLGVAAEAHADWCSSPRRFGGPQSADYFCDESGGSTCYVGSRHSDVFLRLYDWGIAHKQGPAGTVWRYEAELKGKWAKSAIADLRAETQKQLAISGMVYSLFSDRQVQPLYEEDAVSIHVEPTQPTDVQRKLKWLAEQVAPSVAWLADRGHFDEAVAALGLTDVV